MLWLIIGVSGVSCGGKSTVTKSISEYLSDPSNRQSLRPNLVIGSVKLVQQDDFYFPDEHPIHDRIPHMNKINSEQLKCIDTDKMHQELERILGPNCQHFTGPNVYHQDPAVVELVVNVLIIEGFLLFNDQVVSRMCQLKFFIHASYETASKRRAERPHEQPDVPGYFAEVVWPWYQRNFEAIECKDDIVMLNGDDSKEHVFQQVLDGIKGAFQIPSRVEWRFGSQWGWVMIIYMDWCSFIAK